MSQIDTLLTRIAQKHLDIDSLASRAPSKPRSRLA